MINEEYIEKYIRKITPENKNNLQVLEKYAEENRIPIVEPEVAQLLKVLVKIKKPEKILEIGTAIGYSALIMAESYENTKITTIEKNPEMIKLAEENISKTNHKSRIKVIEGDANLILKELNEENIPIKSS